MSSKTETVYYAEGDGGDYQVVYQGARDYNEALRVARWDLLNATEVEVRRVSFTVIDDELRAQMEAESEPRLTIPQVVYSYVSTLALNPPGTFNAGGWASCGQDWNADYTTLNLAYWHALDLGLAEVRGGKVLITTDGQRFADEYEGREKEWPGMVPRFDNNLNLDTDAPVEF